MATKAVVTPVNLGTEFDVGVIETSKIRLKLGGSLKRDAASGTIEVGLGATFGVGAPSVAPAASAPLRYVDTSGTPYVEYVYHAGAWRLIGGPVIATCYGSL